MLLNFNQVFGHIVFYEENHMYVDTNTGKILVSVTTEKKNYLHPFDDTLVVKCAKREGCTVEEMQERWNELARIGKERGTILHNYCQNLSYRKISKVDKSEYPYMDNLLNQIHMFFKDYSHWTTLAVECVIGDENTAGQFDRLAKDEITGEILLIDYKFQKSFKGNYGKMMLSPYEMYPQDTLHEYGWQLSKYKSILENKGFKIDGMKLVHFNYEDTTYRIYDAPQIKIL